MNKLLVKTLYGNWEFVKCKKSDLTFDLSDHAQLFVADWQIGNESVKVETLKQITRWVLQHPERYVVLQDFLDDNWLSNFAHLGYGTDEEVEELKRVDAQLKALEPIFHRFLFQIGSNHWMRRFGLHLPADRSQKARSQFNEIYGRIYNANPRFRQFYSQECIVQFNFNLLPNIKLAFVHPSRLGSPTTALNRASQYYGCYGLVIGHIHSSIQKSIQSAMGLKLKIWFASHLFSEQPEYEKARMGVFEPSKPLILGWKVNALSGDWEFDSL